MIYRIVYFSARRLTVKTELFKQKNIKFPFPTYCTSRFVQKTNTTSSKVSSDLTGKNGIQQYNSQAPIGTTQTCSNDPTSEQLVYRGELRKSIKMLKVLTLTTSICGFCIQPFVLNKVWKINPYLAFSVGTVSTVFVFMTPLLVHWLTRRYVTELSFDPTTKTFTATTLTILLMKKKTTFTSEDVFLPDIPGVFTSFLVNNTPMFVDSKSVINIEAYQHLMGYDKPIEAIFEKYKSKKDAVN